MNSHKQLNLENTDTTLQVSLQQSKPVALDVQLTCKSGEMLALIGPSGSGKSTVLRTIAGLNSVQHGRVSSGQTTWLNTHSSISLSPQARKVGMVFQHYALFPHKSALDNVALAIQDGTLKQRRHQAMGWLERTNMTGLELRKPDALSGGQKQRVALARALARNPLALLLDEPFSAVDQQTRRRLYRELAQLRRGLDIPMILVTHDIHEVQLLADTLCLIHRGQTLQQGPVHAVFNAPSSKSVAKLLGHQNLVAAKVVTHDNRHTLYRISKQDTLQGPRRDELPLNAEVTLLIAPTAISLCPDNAPVAVTANRLHGHVRDTVSMGDEWSLRIHLDHVEKSLRFRVPQHSYSLHSIIAGTPVRVSVLPAGIHAIRP